MGKKIVTKGVKIDKVIFFPNWVDTSLTESLTKENVFRKKNGLIGKFYDFIPHVIHASQLIAGVYKDNPVHKIKCLGSACWGPTVPARPRLSG